MKIKVTLGIAVLTLSLYGCGGGAVTGKAISTAATVAELYLSHGPANAAVDAVLPQLSMEDAAELAMARTDIHAISATVGDIRADEPGAIIGILSISERIKTGVESGTAVVTRNKDKLTPDQLAAMKRFRFAVLRTMPVFDALRLARETATGISSQQLKDALTLVTALAELAALVI